MSYKPIGESMKHLRGSRSYKPAYSTSGPQTKRRQINPNREPAGVKTSRLNRAKVGKDSLR